MKRNAEIEILYKTITLWVPDVRVTSPPEAGKPPPPPIISVTLITFPPCLSFMDDLFSRSDPTIKTKVDR